MAADEIARGEIRIDVNQREATAALRQIEADFEKTLKRIDSETATIEIGADLSKLRDKLANAKREVRVLEGAKAVVTVEADAKDLSEKLAEARKEVKYLDGRTAEVEIKVLGAENAQKRLAKIAKAEEDREKAFLRALAEIERAEKKLAAARAAEQRKIEADARRRASLERQRQKELSDRQREIDRDAKRRAALERQRQAQMRANLKAMEQAAKRSRDRTKAELKAVEVDSARRARLNKQRESELARDHGWALQIERDAERARINQERELALIPKMQRRYVALTDTLAKLAEVRRKARGDQQAIARVDLDERAVVAEMQQLRAKLIAMNADAIDLEVNLTPGRDTGDRLRVWLGRNQGGSASIMAAAGTTMGSMLASATVNKYREVADRGIRNVTRDIAGAAALTGGQAIQRGWANFSKAASGFSQMTVRLGPFTATIRQAVVGLSIFAPILIDIVGALGSLVGVVGSAAVGIGALGTAIVGGGLPAMAGMAFVIKDVAQEFTAVKKAQKAYDDAIMKGKTDLAAKKLAELRSVMGNVSKETVAQIGLAQKIGETWDSATKPGRTSVWKAMGEGLQTANDLLPMFARNTNESLRVAGKSLTGWMKSLRSAGGESILGGMMANFNRALGPALDGLGKFMAYLGRVGRIASGELPGLARTFRDWADSLLEGSSNVTTLRGKVLNTIQSAKDLGQFFMSAGRFLKAFFGAGVESGQGFLDTMSAAMDRWTAMIQADGGKNVAEFFKESVKGAQAFYGFLQPIISSFVRWAAVIAPAARWFFEAAGGVAEIAAQLLKVTALSNLVTGLATTLGTLWAIGKISAATRAIGGFTAALLGLSAAQRAAAGTAVASKAAQAASSMPIIVGTGMPGAGVPPALPGTLSKSAKAAGALRTGLTGIGAALGFANPLVGAAIVGAGGLYLGYRLATKGAREAKEEFKQAGEQAKSAADSFRANALGAGSLGDQHERAEIAVRQAREALKAAKKGTDEYRLAQLDLKDAKRQATEAEKQATGATNEMTSAAARQMDREKSRLAQWDKKNAKAKTGLEAEIRMAQSERERAPYVEALNRLMAERAPLDAAAERASNRHAAAAANVARVNAGMLPILGKAEQALGRLARQSGKVARATAMKFTDPGDAGRVAASAGRSLKSGVSNRIVLRIIADSKNADDAIRRLKAARIDTKKLEIVERGGRKAVSVLQDLIGRKLTPKELKIIENGGPKALGLLERLTGFQIKNKKFQVAAVDRASAILSSIIGRVANLRDKTIILTTIERRKLQNHYGPNAADGGVMFASGGAVPNRRQQDRAAVTANFGGTRPSRGGKITSPRYLVGEEPGNPEVVVASNPRYRKQNKEYAKMAAKMVGLEAVEPRFAGGGFDSTGAYNVDTAGLGGHKAPRSPGRVPKGKIKGSGRAYRKKARKKLTSGRQWVGYIDGLSTQQDDLEREITIRSSRVEEPEELLRETGRITDAKGNDLGPKLEANTPAIETYKSQLREVQVAMDALVRVIQEIVRAIPQALSAIKIEDKYRINNIGQIQEAITRDKGRIRAKEKIKKPTKSDKEALKAAKASLKRNEERLDDERDQRRRIGEDKEKLTERRKEAGFDLRDARYDAQDNWALHEGISGKATAQADKENADTADPDRGRGGGGGGSESTGLSYGEQSVAADTEAANALRAFGENFLSGTNTAASQVGASAGSAGGAPGGGAQVNPANLMASGGVAANLTSGGSAASAAMSSGSGAAAAMRSPAVMPQQMYSGPEAFAGPAGVMGGGKTVIFNQTFNQQQDPHTFVKGVEFEVNTAL